LVELASSPVVLANGMALVAGPVAGRLSTALAIAMPAGSRQERADEVGVAHLLEHLAFKGTQNYPTASHLNRSAEYLGMELDGTTTTEYVEFSTAVRAESALQAAELLVDVVAAPSLDADELEPERAVILQEIADAAESPSSRADDLLIAALFAEHRLAKNVVGHAVDVQALTHDRVIAFRDRQWSPAASLAVVAGNLTHLNRRALEDLLAGIPARPVPPLPPPVPPFVRRIELEQRDSDVVHLRLAYSVPGIDFRVRRDRAVGEVFSQLIGGPMGSRLVDELREQHALCYWADGHVWGYENAAYLSVSCSVRPDDLDETYQRIRAILADLATHGPTDEEADRFRAYSTGAVALDFESVTARLDHAIELIMEHSDHAVDPTLHLDEIQTVTKRELAELAASIRLEPCIGAVGPVALAQLA
jgi:predicted Zn-dependent peptidase